MAARIRSSILAVDVDEASRDDAIAGSVVSLVSLDAATTYSWAITFAPQGSTATFTGSASAISPGTFSVDLEGPYLLRLITDATLPTEDVQYVRVRALTAFGNLTLVSAGERRDDTGTIPVDVDVEGWANEQNDNITTLLAFIKPMVSSGRVLYVDANDGTTEYADHDTVQAAIADAVSQTPSSSEPWVVLVRPGTYVEDVEFAAWVHVLGWPGNPDGRTSNAVTIQGTHTTSLAGGTQQALISNLTLETTADVAGLATLTKSGLGTLRLFGTKVSNQGVDAAQGPAVWLSGGDLDVVRSFIVHNLASTDETRRAFLQSGTNTTALFNDTTIAGPSAMEINPASSNFGLSTQLFDCIIQAADAQGVAIAGVPTDLQLHGCRLESGDQTTISINELGAVYAGPVNVSVQFSSLTGDILYDTTNLGGTTDLNLGSVIYDNLVYPGGSPTYVATTKSKTNFYNNTFSGLASENVQDAIDELAFTAAIAPVVYHKNMPEVPNDLVRYRGWAPVTSSLLAVRVYMETKNTVGTYTLTVFNNATGNTVLSAASFDMGTIPSAGTPHTVPLTGVPADLLFSSLDRWTITLTSDDVGFDGEAIYVSLVFNTASGSPAIVQDWATTLLVGSISGGTNPELTAGDVLIAGSSPAAAISSVGQGRLRYNDPSTSFQVSVDGGAWDDIGGGGGSPFIHKNVPTLPNNTFRYEGWVPISAVVGDISVAMATVNTQGTYQATFTNETTGQTMLIGADFAMNGLAAGTVTPLTLTGTLADLTFAAGDQWSVELTSDDLSFDGVGVYFSILFGTDGVIVITGAPDDDHTVEMTVFPNNTVDTSFFAPYGMELVAVKVYSAVVPTTAGVYTLSVIDVDNANNLLSTATFDMTTLAATTLTAMTLTGTVADRDMATGTQMRIRLVSDNVDLVASGVYAQLIYRSQ
jgi:hypothetical protein